MKANSRGGALGLGLLAGALLPGECSGGSALGGKGLQGAPVPAVDLELSNSLDGFDFVE